MKRILTFLAISFFLISCATKQECPPCTSSIEYIKVQVPVNSCLLDNITISKPTQLKPFKFTEKGGIITIEDDDIKNMIYNFQILVTERDMYYDIINKLKNK